MEIQEGWGQCHQNYPYNFSKNLEIPKEWGFKCQKHFQGGDKNIWNHTLQFLMLKVINKVLLRSKYVKDQFPYMLKLELRLNA